MKSRNISRRVFYQQACLIGIVSIFFGTLACQEQPKVEQCQPDCEGRCGLDNGCGETCQCGETPVDPCDRCSAKEVCVDDTCICAPTCDGKRSGPDGCGGTCECPSGKVADAKGDCVIRAECRETCSDAGRVCGEVCGTTCGTCDDSEFCIGGQCASTLSCDDCSLKLSLVSRVVLGEKLRGVTLAIDYMPTENEPRPRMADFRIKADKAVVLEKVQVGPALEEAGKTLFFDELTGNHWKVSEDGSFQLLVFSPSNTKEFAAGRVLTLSFVCDEKDAVAFSLEKRNQTFAPPAADWALQASAYSNAVVVSK